MKALRNIVLAGALAVGLLPAAAAPSPSAELERALAGRVAGEPRDCLLLRDIRSSRVIPRTGILYETNGGKLYLNTPRSGARTLSSFDVLVTDTHSPWLCSIDVVRLVDQGSFMPRGFVGLGPFVPYEKVAASDAR